ncbi:hypothetical protein [Nocardia sp. NPDC051750]|uniref:hypothetical protein n=1 Tax=Nocardia sp. NPDC051750 TaxID=3364325 RepID=UPI0037B31EA5
MIRPTNGTRIGSSGVPSAVPETVMTISPTRPLGVVLRRLPSATPVSPAPAATAGRSAQQPPCASLPDGWDLDSGSPEAWRVAIRTCYGCSLFDQCSKLAQSLIERGDAPRAMIWAGIAYDNSGNVIEDLERHRAVPVDHKRPMRIIRNGPRPARNQPASAAPKRHIVLGRPLRPNETIGA